MKFLALIVQKLLPQQTNIQTDLTKIITYPHTRMVKIKALKTWLHPYSAYTQYESGTNNMQTVGRTIHLSIDIQVADFH